MMVQRRDPPSDLSQLSVLVKMWRRSMAQDEWLTPYAATFGGASPVNAPLCPVVHVLRAQRITSPQRLATAG